jgi:hypothetical protein
MSTPWYRKLFSASQPDATSAQARAEAGNADAQFELGLKLASSPGEAQDNLQAAQWYLKAADQSHALAQFNLGVMYAQGQGVVRNEATAFVWFERAAQQGDAGAQFHLGMRHHRASGLSGGLPGEAHESKIEAYKWFFLAAAQGYRGSDSACERVTLSMSREELADGNRRAAAFVVAKLTPDV